MPFKLNRHNALIVLASVFAFALTACSTIDQFMAPPTPRPTPKRTSPPVSSAPSTKVGRTIGNPNAAVTLVVYTDFQ